MKPLPNELESEWFRRTSKYCKYISWIPGLRMVAVCNTLALYASDPDSDIDLFIVTDPRRMWLVRLLVTWIFHLLGVRRHANHVAGRFCLSFFATTNSLDLSEIAIEDDIYLAVWAKYLKPILDIGDTYDEFTQANSGWIGKLLPDFDTLGSSYDRDAMLRHLTYKKPNTPERFGRLWDLMDSFFKRVFLPKTLREYNRLGKPWGIIISDNMLKFHKNDRRKEVREEWRSKDA